MTTLKDALARFADMTQAQISEALSSEGIDVISVCKGPRSENCPFAEYLTREIGERVTVWTERAFFSGRGWTGGEARPLPSSVIKWIDAWDQRDAGLAELQQQHNRSLDLG